MGYSLRHLFLILIIFIQFLFIFSDEYKKCGQKKDKNEGIEKEDDCKPTNNELIGEENCCFVRVENMGKPHCTKLSKNITDEMKKEIEDTLSKKIEIKCFK